MKFSVISLYRSWKKNIFFWGGGYIFDAPARYVCAWLMGCWEHCGQRAACFVSLYSSTNLVTSFFINFVTVAFRLHLSSAHAQQTSSHRRANNVLDREPAPILELWRNCSTRCGPDVYGKVKLATAGKCVWADTYTVVQKADDVFFHRSLWYNKRQTDHINRM